MPGVCAEGRGSGEENTPTSLALGPQLSSWYLPMASKGVSQNEAIYVCSLSEQRAGQQRMDPGGNRKETGNKKGITASTPTSQGWSSPKIPNTKIKLNIIYIGSGP